jgi:hypothetical protein
MRKRNYEEFIATSPRALLPKTDEDSRMDQAAYLALVDAKGSPA